MYDEIVNILYDEYGMRRDIEVKETKVIKKRSAIQRILNYFGYFKPDQLTHEGNCGCCGKYMKGVFLKKWTWGICEKCQETESRERSFKKEGNIF